MSSTTASGSDRRDWREERRRRGVELYQAGWLQTDIAEALGVTQGAVSQWVKAEREHGAVGLASQPHPGPTPKLSQEQREQLPALLGQGAEAQGFRGAVWTCERVAAVIERHFGVSYHPTHVGRLLAQLGWSRQKPLRRDVKRNEEAVTTFQEEEFPALKRGPGSEEPPCCSLMSAASTRCRQ